MKNIAVIGLGYVGLSNALMLAKNNQVLGYDLDINKIKLLTQKNLPFKDEFMSEYFKKQELRISFTSSFQDLKPSLDYVFIALPTNFKEDLNQFDTSIIEEVLSRLSTLNFQGKIIIKSTVYIGFTEKMAKKLLNLKLLFSPEFLREGQALYDNFFPSRIIIGSSEDADIELEKTLRESIKDKDVEVLHTSLSEAEAIKLFSNTYLAMRVAFFNEIDTFSKIQKLSSEKIIKGLSLDSRIGDYYNNPSFGYGGYCLPKDTKQMLSNFHNIPQKMMSAIVDANETRKRFIADQIINQNPKVVGVYRLIMKTGSDNFRESAIFDVMNYIKNSGIKIIIFEPELFKTDHEFDGVIDNIEVFKEQSDIIIANRLEDAILDAKDKVYTRDIFHNN